MSRAVMYLLILKTIFGVSSSVAAPQLSPATNVGDNPRDISSRSSRIEFVEKTFLADPSVQTNRDLYYRLDWKADKKDAELYQLSSSTRDPFLESAKLGAKLSEMNPEWERLSLYPGVVQRSEEFIDFAQAQPNRSISARELYRKFDKRLGSVTLYRGISVPNDALDEIKAQGLQATSLKRKLFKPGMYMAGIHTQIVNREKMLNPEQDHLISVTFDHDAAVWFAKVFSSKAPGSQIVIIKMRIPLVELVDAGQKGIITLKNFDQPTGHIVESYIPFIVSAEEIVGIELIAGADPQH